MFLFWTSFWRFEYVLVVRVDDVEQMKKKWTDRVDLTKKTSHCKSRDFLRKRRVKIQNNLVFCIEVIIIRKEVLNKNILKENGESGPKAKCYVFC